MGAAYVEADFLGIPYKSLYAATNFGDALRIVKAFTDKTGTKPAVSLTGFGLSGINTGKPAGGLKTAAALGGKKEIDALVSFCKSNTAGLYMDYNITKFSKSGLGISKNV